jgi:hypothetical protein
MLEFQRAGASTHGCSGRRAPSIQRPSTFGHVASSGHRALRAREPASGAAAAAAREREVLCRGFLGSIFGRCERRARLPRLSCATRRWRTSAEAIPPPHRPLSRSKQKADSQSKLADNQPSLEDNLGEEAVSAPLCHPWPTLRRRMQLPTTSCLPENPRLAAERAGAGGDVAGGRLHGADRVQERGPGQRGGAGEPLHQGAAPARCRALRWRRPPGQRRRQARPLRAGSPPGGPTITPPAAALAPRRWAGPRAPPARWRWRCRTATW